MKKRLLFAVLIFAAMTMTVLAQQTTIVAWSFPTGTLADSVADDGIVGNIGSRTIRAEGGANPFEVVAGATTSALQTAGWDDGAGAKFWSIIFKAEGYNTLKLSCKQASDVADLGPANWKIQYMISGGAWTDVPGGTIVCENNWTGAVVNELALPITGQGSSLIYIRWVMTSNLNTAGETTLAAGKSLIDDIIVTGIPDVVVVSGDTIIGFNFLDNTDTEFNADFGLVGNLSYNIRAENTAGDVRVLTYTTGATDNAATATGWDAGAEDKCWSINFNADGYSNFKLYSKQRAGGSNPGPKNWKIQTRLSTGTWEDVTGGTVTVANNWTTGAVNDLALPATLDNPGTTSIYVRWIMIDNEDVNGGTVAAAGISKIDDILITGVSISGNGAVVFEHNSSVYPNPCSEMLTITSDDEMSKVEVYNIQGKIICEMNSNSTELHMDINNFSNGMYFLRIFHKNESFSVTRKLIVE